MTRVPFPWLKPALLTGAAVPLVDVGVGALRGTLGADAVALVLNRLGLVALLFLVASLACTPLQRVWGWTWPLRIRRTLGVLSFAYAALHLSVYLVLDQFFDWSVIWADITQRKFIIVGLLAFLCLLPLAITSTNAMVRRLGFSRWKALHRLAYAGGLLAAIHFVWRVKRDHREPFTYLAVLLGLLALRLLPDRKKVKRTSLA